MNKKLVAILLMASLFVFAFSLPALAEDNGSTSNEGAPIRLTEDEQGATLLEDDEQNNDEENADNPVEEWPTSFTDVKESDWFYNSVKFVAEEKIANGTGGGKFSPNETLTRAMLVTFMYRYAGEPKEEGDVSFGDIDKNEYYYNALVWASKHGIVLGQSDGTFAPNKAILRQEVASILSRYATYQGKSINGWLDLYDFYDGGKVHSYARTSMQWAYSYNIIIGKTGGLLDPMGNATRAECAKIIYTYNSADFSQIPTSAPSLFNGNHIVTYDAMCGYLNTMTKMYPNLIRVSSAGKSEEGRDIKLVTFGTGSRYIYLQGNLHAREYLSLNYLLEVLDSYSYAYATNSSFNGYDVRSLLSQFTMIILPCTNPDGQNIAINGYSAAANPAAVAAMYNPTGNHALWKANAQGVDLNRNFPAHWKPGSTKRPAFMEYGGPSAGSAKETKAVMNVLASKRFETGLDFHTAGNLLYYTDGSCSAAYKARATALTTKLAASSGYRPSAASAGPGAANYIRNQYGVPGITVELYPTVAYPLDCSRFTSAVWNKAKNIPLVTIDFLLKN